MDYEREICALSAETLALQAVLNSVLARIVAADPKLMPAIAHGFDDAANHVENLAIKLGKAARPEHTVKALRIVEEMRAATFGDHDEPRHGV